ncbi:MAG: hypothetical protein C4557_03965 [Anaerolineaceae bacterium]|nr:MAG: hypothetical protein C4557_03965 [Anaerolineaceae bacterium]
MSEERQAKNLTYRRLLQDIYYLYFGAIFFGVSASIASLRCLFILIVIYLIWIFKKIWSFHDQ